MIKSSKDWRRIAVSIFVLIVLVGAVIAGVTLVGQEQDIRDKAASDNACSKALDSCNQSSCCSGLVCQGSTGNKFCQDPGDTSSCSSNGAVCGGQRGYIGFKCDKLSDGQCSKNPKTFDSFSEASSYAGGCGQVDEVWVNGPCNRHLCGNFEIFNSSCGSSSSDGGNDNNGGNSSGFSCGSKCKVGANNGPDCPSCQDSADGAMGDGTGKCWCGKSKDDDDDKEKAIKGQCLNVKTFDSGWNLITSDKYNTLKAGDVVRFSVSATANSGTYNKARFVINGATSPEVTTRRPNTNEFYYEYTIPSGLTQLSVQGQVHHNKLGWF